MIISSSLSILASNCVFEETMQGSAISYMMFLLYYRSPECSDHFYWNLLVKNNFTQQNSSQILNFNLNILNFIPEENEATKRTFTISLSYLSINILTLITSIILIGENFSCFY